MRVARSASLLSVSLAAVFACSDDIGTPVPATWLEWSDSVAAGVPFGVRVSLGTSHNRTSLRLLVNVARDTLTIEPYSVEPPCGGLRGRCVTRPYGYDTLLWVPAIAATTARTVVIRAPTTLNPDELPPWPLRTFGTVTISVDTPVAPHLRSVGMAVGNQQSAGCYLVRDLSFYHIYVSADTNPAWAPHFQGFVYGRTDPVLRSTCRDDTYVIQIDSIIP